MKEPTTFPRYCFFCERRFDLDHAEVKQLEAAGGLLVCEKCIKEKGDGKGRIPVTIARIRKQRAN